MSQINMSVTQIRELGLLSKVLDSLNMPYALSEGQIDGDTVLEFDTEFEPVQYYYDETLEMIKLRKYEIAERFEKECLHLLRSGCIDKQNHNRGLLFGVAVENIADNYLSGERNTSNYKNMKRF